MKILISILLIVIILFGFYFRLYGIADNHSFWDDEAFVSTLARDVINGQKTLPAAIQPLNYQSLYLIIITLSLRLFGQNEFAARLPSALFGTIGIFFAFLIAKKLSNWSGGLLAAYLFAFSQLNLAYATQAKSYTILQTLLLIVIYLLTLLPSQRGRIKMVNHIFTVITLMLATFFHIIGVLFWIIYFTSLKFLKKPPVIMIILFILSFVFIKFQLINYNHTMYLKNLLLRQYGIFLLPAIFGMMMTFKKNHALTVGLILWAAILLFFWNFYHATHNVRYLVPFFGIIFVFFGVFWGMIGERYSKNFQFPIFNGFDSAHHCPERSRTDNFQLNASIVPSLLVAIILTATQYKIALKPMSNYSPNTDFYGDVQIADYKTAYSLVKTKFPNLSDVAIFNDWYDTQAWYLSEKPVDAYFMIGTKKPYKHSLSGKMVFGTLSDFLKEKTKYPRGLLIVEDWQSILPEEIKQYAKKNMKIEFRVESLPQAKNDPWPLEIYSWGFD